MPTTKTKTRARAEPRKPKPRKPEVWKLRLYVAGQTPKSIRAFANLKVLCEEHLEGPLSDRSDRPVGESAHGARRPDRRTSDPGRQTFRNLSERSLETCPTPTGCWWAWLCNGRLTRLEGPMKGPKSTRPRRQVLRLYVSGSTLKSSWRREYQAGVRAALEGRYAWKSSTFTRRIWPRRADCGGAHAHQTAPAPLQRLLATCRT